MAAHSRFNQEQDYRRGEIGPGRIKEIIKEAIRYIDEKYLTDPATIAEANKVTSSLIKELKYAKYEESSGKDVESKREDAKEFFERQSKFNNDAWLFHLIRANIEMIKFEHFLTQKKREEILSNLSDLQEKTSSAFQEQRNREFSEFDKQKLLILQQQLARLNELEKASRERLSGLYLHHEKLVAHIEENKKEIKAIRKHHAKNISNHLKNLQINGVKVCEGMSDAQIDRLGEDLLPFMKLKRKNMRCLKEKLT